MSIGAVKSGVDPIAAYSSQTAANPPVSGVQPASSDTGDTAETVSTDQKANKKDVKVEDVQQMTYAMNQFVEALNTDIHFVVHDKTKELMVEVVDKKTNKVIREYPSHEFLDTMAAIRSYIGILLDKKI
ncbi:MAG: flagellar protein FlaG [Veillonellales bacterium]